MASTSKVYRLPLRHAPRVLDSLGARNRSFSLLWLVHPIALATGTARSYGCMVAPYIQVENLPAAASQQQKIAQPSRA